MHEMVLVTAVIVLTLMVMGGLVVIFRRWLAARDDLMRRAWAETGPDARAAQEVVRPGAPSKEKRRAATA